MAVLKWGTRDLGTLPLARRPHCHGRTDDGLLKAEGQRSNWIVTTINLGKAHSERVLFMARRAATATRCPSTSAKRSGAPQFSHWVDLSHCDHDIRWGAALQEGRQVATSVSRRPPMTGTGVWQGGSGTVPLQDNMVLVSNPAGCADPATSRPCRPHAWALAMDPWWGRLLH